ncbi:MULTISPECIES: siderophore-interacting protein [unclassified Caballeronia]|uniref:siderophore-interacting protein n=1 Tax=unclassified Caballeronia TaxID=2646786 RepID=UPI0028551A1C|nr:MULTISPECIES: siderophore-interacting protein [unclassified Caballeronia]MDR5752613.1 siderophore-interacting protein [Caballeronia sp. LZ024]MDR5841628.1 siderophore-interacting protein [Caballeronia sp. LZ031]
MDIDSFRRSPRLRVSAIVLQTLEITPRMRRLVLGGPDLRAWIESDGVREAAAWVKVFPSGREGRAYTIRHVDDAAGTVDIDFVLHGEFNDSGSVSDWARTARRGDQVDIAGPRNGGFFLLPDSKWVWIAADASARPAAQSIMERLPHGIRTVAVIDVHDDEEQRQLVQSPERLHLQWHHWRQRTNTLEEADLLLARINGLDGPGQVWMAGEAEWVRSWRTFWLEHRKLDRHRLSSKVYWKIGTRDHRD